MSYCALYTHMCIWTIMMHNSSQPSHHTVQRARVSVQTISAAMTEFKEVRLAAYGGKRCACNQ